MMADLSTIQTSEGVHTVSDGTKLYNKTWKVHAAHISFTPQVPTDRSNQAVGTLKARLIFIHGFSDHINAYGIFFPTLATHGISTYGFDQRGWGRSVNSPSEKGHTGPTSVVLSDMTSFIKSVLHSSSSDDDGEGTPVFLMGHSMGGAQVLCYIAQGPSDVVSKIRGFLLEAPFLALHKDTKPSIITLLMGRFAGKLVPRRQMVFPLDEKLMSRDPQVQKDFAEDELCHNTATLEGMAGNLDRSASLDSGKILVTEGKGEGGKTRVWLGHGTKDGVCDYKASEKLYDRMNDVMDKELKLYEGWYHKCKCLPFGRWDSA